MDNGASSYRHFLAGDESAFSELLTMYRDNLIFFLNRTVNNLDVAEEIAAESFAELIIHPSRYKGQVLFKTYLFSIAHHKMVDYIRKQERIRASADLLCSEKSAAYRSFEEDILKKERHRVLINAMGKLPPAFRTVLHLIYFEDMSYEDAAKVMKKNRKQIDNLIYRGKNALRRILREEGFEYEDGI